MIQFQENARTDSTDGKMEGGKDRQTLLHRTILPTARGPKIPEILSTNFFDSEIGEWGNNQYKIQVMVECQVVNLPSNWEGILLLKNKYNKHKI